MQAHQLTMAEPPRLPLDWWQRITVA
jgi:hypothetical protein